MSAHTSLFDLTQQLLHDDGARAAFAEDPDAFLDQHGLADLSPDDVADGLGFVADALPPALAVQLPNAWADDSAGLPHDAAAVVDQLRAITEVDPDLTLEEPSADLGEDGFDDDPHGGFDDLTQSAPDGADDLPPDSSDPSAGGDDAPAPDEPHATDQGGFGTGGAVEDARQVASSPDATESADDTSSDSLDDGSSSFEMGSDPSFDFGADDSFLTPPVPDEHGDADELDTDNGDWDGSWDDLQGHHLF